MRFTDLFIRRPVLATVVSLLILLAGAIALVSLPLRQFPNLESATIVVDTSFPGATQEVMQGFVTTPIAQSIATTNGIEYLTSTSSPGKSQIKARLVLNTNADRSMTEVLAKVQEVKFRLPAGVTDPVITKITDSSNGILYIAFVSKTLSSPQITDFALRVAQPLFTAIPGVAAVDIHGGKPLAMRVWIDPVKLAARGLTAGDVAQALKANNVQAAPGQLKGQATVTNITATTDLSSIDAFRQMVIKTGTDSLVRLGDVASVEIGPQNYNSSARHNGQPAVFVGLRPTPDSNPLDIIKAAVALLPQIQKAAPPGLEVHKGYDIAIHINASLGEVQRTLIEAGVVVIIVIVLFLGSFRAALIPVVTIPLSLIGTAALMLALGFSLNTLTLLAMVLAIGLVVDDAIVVVENIHRHVEEGLSRFQAAITGAREIITPVIAMTITLAAVYAPIGLMGGLTGVLFREFAFTLAGAVIVSGVIALTLSPVMSSRLLQVKASEGRFAKAIEHGLNALSNAYGRVLARTLEMRPAVLTVATAALIAVVVQFNGSERELAPQLNAGWVDTVIRAPQYANIDYTEASTDAVERVFRTLPEYTSSFAFNGTDGQNNAAAGVELTHWDNRKRSASVIQSELQTALNGVLGALVTTFLYPPLPGSSDGLQFQMVLRSPADFAAIYRDLEILKTAARDSGLFAFVDSDLALDSSDARITIDHAKAGEVGLTMQAIAETLAVLVGENYVNRFNFYERSYDVITQVRQQDRVTPDSLGSFQVRSRSGEMIPLSTVIKVEVRPQPNRLPQFNQMNAATMSAVLNPGTTMGQAVTFMQAQPIAAGASIDWLSGSRQFVQEGNRLTVIFGMALVVIFLVLAAQFESFRDPLIILVTVPLAVCGALLPIYLGFTTLNVYAQIGLITLIGLITKHGILMVTFANESQHSGLDRKTAIIAAAKIRMRPVLMTTAAMVASLVPLLFAGGAGGASRFAIGIVVVMGMLIGTLFTLFVLPTFYVLIARDHTRGHHGSLRPRR